MVRHASAGDRDRWRGDDRLRPLDGKGRHQAKGLAALLGRLAAEGRVLSSPYVRCVQTVEPLGAARQVGVETTESLAEGAGLGVLDLVRGAGDGAVLCTHGDVVADLVDHLARHGLAGMNAGAQKASTWLLELEGERVTQATYLPPPH